jgi:hypothetical protein
VVGVEPRTPQNLTSIRFLPWHAQMKQGTRNQSLSLPAAHIVFNFLGINPIRKSI